MIRVRIKKDLIDLHGFDLLMEGSNGIYDYLLKRNGTCVVHKENSGYEVFKSKGEVYITSGVKPDMDFKTVTHYIKIIDEL